MILGKYPQTHVMNQATGPGLYGFYQPMGKSYFDPGKWSVCDSLGSDVSHYCYIYLEIPNSSHSESFVVGACAPPSCGTDDLNSMQPGVVASALNLPSYFKEGFVADCTKKEPAPVGTWIIVGLYAFLMTIVAIGTIIDAQLTYKVFSLPKQIQFVKDYQEESYLLGGIDDEKKETQAAVDVKLEDKHPHIVVRVLLSFSLLYNYARLVSSPPPGNFEALNGVRVIAMAFVVLGHTFYFMWDTMAMLNAQEIILVVREFRFQLVIAGFYAVDTFFFLSGFLVAYFFVKELQGRGLKPMVLFMYYFHRIYRLTPALFMGLMFFWLITPYWDNGPYWIFYQKFVNDHCNDGWWYTLLYIQNFIDPKKLCMGWSWYLADDMQYYILSPFVLVLYWKNKWAGWIVTVLGILGCIACNIGLGIGDNLQEFAGLQMGSEIGFYTPPGAKFGPTVYLPPWTRVSPYLVGFCCAFILLERGTNFKLSAFLRTGIYTSSTLIIFILSFITYTDANYGWAQWMNVVWIGFSRTMWSIGLGALLIMCVIGYGGAFNAAMSAKFWIPFARLSYSAYLFHLSNISTVYNGYKSAYTYQFSSVLYFFIGHLTIAFLLSFINYVLVEKPLMNIESLILRPKKKKT